jgi:hypothetical protein
MKENKKRTACSKSNRVAMVNERGKDAGYYLKITKI